MEVGTLQVNKKLTTSLWQSCRVVAFSSQNALSRAASSGAGRWHLRFFWMSPLRVQYRLYRCFCSLWVEKLLCTPKTGRPHISWSLDWFEDETTSKGLKFLVAELNTWNSGSNLGLARYQLHCPSMQWTKLISSQKTSRFEVGYATLCMSRCACHVV